MTRGRGNIARTAAATAILALMAGCGEGDHNGNAANQASVQTVRTGQANWNPLDACATLRNAAAAAAGGSKVTSATLSTVMPGTTSTAAFSTCFFTFDNGGSMVLLTRESPIADATDGAIAAARTSGGMAEPATDVPGLGKAAPWNDQMKSLQVFIDDKRFVSIAFSGLPAGVGSRALSVAVAKALL